jgi:hypothetical protein
MENEKDIKELIDSDRGLIAKRRLLISTSILFILIQFSGVKVLEANTLIFKLTISNPNGIGIFFLMAIAFLLIRYLGYATPYHEKLFKLWSNRMLHDRFIHSYFHDDEPSGMIVDIRPKGVEFDHYYHLENEHYSCTYRYVCKFPFRRYIQYAWGNGHDDHQETVSILSKVSISQYLKVLTAEAVYQFDSLIRHRENLDVLTPYFIGISALLCWLFDSQLHELIS